VAEKKGLKKLWARFDDLGCFHPARWPHAEMISRLTALVIVGAFLVQRFLKFDTFPQSYPGAVMFYGAFQSASGGPVYSAAAITLLWTVKLLVWLMETAIYLGYIASYVSRVEARAVASGFMQTAYPVMIAGLPVLIALAPYTLPRWAPFTSRYHLAYYLTIMGLILVGGSINLAGLLTLRRSFTIMAEARDLVTRGLFRYVRHPLYSGHFVMFLGSLLLRLHLYTLILYLAFIIGQVHRAWIEEDKLMQVFPEYERYKTRTGMFLPRLKANRYKAP
jgi:protein-S-isoprenylcysteine O-methyltransferase Ste14